MSKNIVQIENQYIRGEGQRRKFLAEEVRRKNRFMAWVLILVILLFILPTYNLMESYKLLIKRREQLSQLKKEYKQLEEREKAQSDLANKLKDDDYAAKYARAKYFYSKEGEYIYNAPNILPQ
ncbi:Cell division protein DivIC (FtsB), stabilizes FtsL against RasP cleavage [Streptococcus sp. DD10]|uniref:septum formation initiator family protein n=1 Tax=Streptococcus sp. DD10 TaxID=1777878 RepID=UPI0007948207|nr:septum formation initiator family protein [Streptococcus sp. DD10]KXT74238.1 Cell division protein DivIC (FtsB), stabilizes FtsL against RasP cleavage [Streptococcus sp. DD10]